VAGIPPTALAEDRQIDLDGSDEVERGVLNLIEPLGGAFLHDKIAAASGRLAIIVEDAKTSDQAGAENNSLPRPALRPGLASVL
jgi:ribose 5-phosphate isomerase A